MSKLTRRRALQLSGIGVVSGLAGCLDSLGVGGQPADGDTEVVDSTIHPLGATLSMPGGYHADKEYGDVVLIDTADRFEALKVAYNLEEALDDASIDGFDFDDVVVLFAWVAGPNTCYDKYEVGEVDIEDDTLQTTVESVGPDEPKVCGEAVTFVRVLIEVEFDGEAPSQAAVTLIDGWEEERTVTVDSKEQLDPA